MTHILGISAFYHDSAAALIRDGDILAAAQEERFSRIKHDHAFPARAVSYCLKEAGITPADLDHVVFYDKPLLKLDRLLETYLAHAPRGYRSFMKAVPLWLRHKLHMQREMDRGLNRQFRGRYLFLEHHESHAASAYFPSPFEEAALLTLDGVGEWATASYGIGRGNHIELLEELRFPHSLGMLYSAFTAYCGFRVNRGEYKLMGLAPYGEPCFAETIRKHLIEIAADGSFHVNQDYFAYCHGLTMTSQRLHRLLGAPPRKPESPLTQLYMDAAASIQVVTEDVVLSIARYVRCQTRAKRLCLAGGVALNCVANGRLLREGPFEELWIQPAAGDAGGALGAALFVWHQLLDKPREPQARDSQQGALLGPKYSSEAIEAYLQSIGASYERIPHESELLRRVAQLIADEKVVGWLQGRMEFGPRALGSRSILGDARSERMQRQMNLKIKFRESFRPFAPSVLQEEAHRYFQVSPNHESPYMLLVASVRPEHRLDVEERLRQCSGMEKLHVVRSTIPAVTHVDFSARLQTVDAERHGRYYRLVKEFFRMTGCPVIVNTSFNIRGEPIVCSPEEALRCFMATNIDALVLEDCLLLKAAQPAHPGRVSEKYLHQYEPRAERKMRFSATIWHPTPTQLRMFSVIWCLVCAAWAITLHHRGACPPACCLGLAAVGVTGLLTGLLLPPLVRPLWLLLTLLTYPVGFVLSHILLSIVYCVLVTPTAIVFRLRRRDALQLKRGTRNSWWHTRAPRGRSSYFKQY